MSILNINKKRLIMFLVSITLLFSTIQVFAASASASGPGTISQGQVGYITITTNAPGGFFQGTITSNNPGIASAGTGNLYGDSGESSTMSPSQTIEIIGNQVGTATFTISLIGEDIKENPMSLDTTITVTVIPNGSGGNTTTNGGTGNTGSGSEGTYNPNVNSETEEEKAAREAREKEAELEEKRKNSLIESIEIVSNEEKRKGETLKSLELEGEKYDYAYTLPTFMSKITLNVKASDDVQLEYEKEHEITGAKEIKIKAVSGEITQDFVLTLDSSNSEENKTEDGFIYYDEKLDEAFKDLGFESKTLEADDKELSVFNRNKLNLQMIVNDDHEVLFYNLDEKGALLDKGQLLVSDKDVLFVVEEAEAELLDKKLYGNSYDKLDLPKPEFLEALDPTLTVKQIASGWVFEDGSIVSAYNDNLDKDLYNIVPETPFKAAVVAFDGKSDSNITFALIASLVALLGVSVAFVLYHLKTKKKIQLLLGRKEI